MSSQDALDIHQTGLLSDVTLSALQLHRQPFSQVASDVSIFGDDTSAEQLADVKQALINGDDLLLILGEHGAGKSILLNQLGTNSGMRIQCFAVKGSPRFSTLNLFAGMLEAFKRKPPEKLKDILDQLVPCLQTMAARDTLSAIVLDDANLISETELTQLLSSMLYINSQDETLMRVALAAPSEFEDRIPDLLPEGADLPYSSLTIDGMTEPRAAEYLDFRLQEAGYAGEFPFTAQNIKEMVRQSGGFPAGLHVAAADTLNQHFDPEAVEQLAEVDFAIEESEPFLQSRKGKLGLGLLASALILIGLTMFVPDAADDQERYGTSEAQPQQDLLSGSEPLRVVEERKLVPLPPEPVETTPAVPAPTDVIDVPERIDPTEITINGAADTAEAGTVATDDDTLTESASQDTADTAGDTAGDDFTENAASDTQGAAELPASADISPQVESAPVIIVPESESADASSAADSTAPLAEPVDTTETSASEAVETQATDEQTEAASAPDTGSEEPPVVNREPDVNPEVADILESPTWILVQDPALITVQMSASRDRKSIENFLQRNRAALSPPNSIYSFQRNGETWFALLHGLFESFNAAQVAVEKMPAAALTDQPWIRNVGRIQTVLKAQ